MTEDQIKALREAAEKATPGPWNNGGSSVDDFDDDCTMRMEWLPNGRPQDGDDEQVNANYRNDAAYIALANPANILSLIEERDRLRRLLESAADALDELSARAGGWGVSGVYFDEPIFTDNVAALKLADEAADQARSALNQGNRDNG